MTIGIFVIALLLVGILLTTDRKPKSKESKDTDKKEKNGDKKTGWERFAMGFRMWLNIMLIQATLVADVFVIFWDHIWRSQGEIFWLGIFLQVTVNLVIAYKGIKLLNPAKPEGVEKFRDWCLGISIAALIILVSLNAAGVINTPKVTLADWLIAQRHHVSRVLPATQKSLLDPDSRPKGEKKVEKPSTPKKVKDKEDVNLGDIFQKGLK